MKKRVRLIIASILTTVMIGWFFYHNTSTKVSWQEIKKGPVISAIYGLGTVTSDKVYRLKVAVPTHVKELYVHEGDEVKKGQPLALLNGLPLFRASFEGTITSLPLNKNETVSPNTEVLTLMDLRDCYILVSLEQESAVKIIKGQKVKLTFSGLPNQQFNGTVASVYPKDQESYVKIIVDHLPASILPKMSSDVAIVLEEKPKALLIPINALHNSMVTIRRQGKTLHLPVQLGTMADDFAEVVSNNLNENDLILVKA